MPQHIRPFIEWHLLTSLTPLSAIPHHHTYLFPEFHICILNCLIDISIWIPNRLSQNLGCLKLTISSSPSQTCSTCLFCSFQLMTTSFFQLLRLQTNSHLWLFSAPYIQSNLSLNIVGFIFKIYTEFSLFSQSLLLLSWFNPLSFMVRLDCCNGFRICLFLSPIPFTKQKAEWAF